jgi:ELWxxDGT repeat protein
MISSVSSPASSLGCNAGGRVISQGLDNGDGGGTAQNGILDSGEVDYVTTFCSKFDMSMRSDIFIGSSNSNIDTPEENCWRGKDRFAVVGDTIYFAADDGTHGRELWAYNTVNQSTWLAADMSSGSYPGQTSSDPGDTSGFTVVDTRIYFDVKGKLWVYEISNSTAWNLHSSHIGVGDCFGIISIGANIYYDAHPGSGWNLYVHYPSNGTSVAVTSGMLVGTYLTTVIDTAIIFDAGSGSSTSSELYAHETTNSTTWLVADINNGTSGSMPGRYAHQVVGDRLYFDANDGVNGLELWVLDTSNWSVWQTPDISNGSASSYPGSYSRSLGLVGNTLFFDAYTYSNGIAGTNSGYELYAHDTVNGSTWFVKRIQSGSGPWASSFPGQMMGFHTVGTQVYFDADNGGNNFSSTQRGRELWVHDTSNSSTWRATDIAAGTNDSIDVEPANDGITCTHGSSTDCLTTQVAVLGTKLIFNANDTSGSQLWSYDILTSTVSQITDFESIPGNDPDLLVVGDYIYFIANDGQSGLELWRLGIEDSVTYS